MLVCCGSGPWEGTVKQEKGRSREPEMLAGKWWRLSPGTSSVHGYQVESGYCIQSMVGQQLHKDRLGGCSEQMPEGRKRDRGRLPRVVSAGVHSHSKGFWVIHIPVAYPQEGRCQVTIAVGSPGNKRVAVSCQPTTCMAAAESVLRSGSGKQGPARKGVRRPCCCCYLSAQLHCQASPENMSSYQKRDFQCEVLLSTMEIFHLMSMDNAPALRGECTLCAVAYSQARLLHTCRL